MQYHNIWSMTWFKMLRCIFHSKPHWLLALSLGTLNISIKTLYVRLVAAEPAFSSAIIRCPNVDIDLINIKMTARQLQLFDSDLKQRATFYEQLSTFIYDSLQSASSRKLLDGESRERCARVLDNRRWVFFLDMVERSVLREARWWIGWLSIERLQTMALWVVLVEYRHRA